MSVGAVHVRETFPLPVVPDNTTLETMTGVPSMVPLAVPVPAALIAETRKVYSWPSAKLLTDAKAAEVLVFAIAVVQVSPLSSEISMKYPVIAAPPVFAGETQDKMTEPLPGVATNPVGASARAAATTATAALLEPVPAMFTALTRYK